jgi:SAM-dependent methyltransferase
VRRANPSKGRFKKIHNPPTGYDISEVKIEQIKEVLTANLVQWSPWEEAQLRELGFWRWVAFEGYNGKKPRAFFKHQKRFMLNSYSRTNWKINEFEAGTILELGCGPLGMLEFLKAKVKVGVDPLNSYYSLLFLKLRRSNVHYLEDLEELDVSMKADLIICFNVIDHTANPGYYIDKLFGHLKSNGKFIIEVNCHEDKFEVTAEHARMNPSPLSVEEIRELVSGYGRIEGEELATIPTADNEFPFLIWGKKK